MHIVRLVSDTLHAQRWRFAHCRISRRGLLFHCLLSGMLLQRPDDRAFSLIAYSILLCIVGNLFLLVSCESRLKNLWPKELTEKDHILIYGCRVETILWMERSSAVYCSPHCRYNIFSVFTIASLCHCIPSNLETDNLQKRADHWWQARAQISSGALFAVHPKRGRCLKPQFWKENWKFAIHSYCVDQPCTQPCLHTIFQCLRGTFVLSHLVERDCHTRSAVACTILVTNKQLHKYHNARLPLQTHWFWVKAQMPPTNSDSVSRWTSRNAVMSATWPADGHDGQLMGLFN